jgi:WD40 repeat protein
LLSTVLNISTPAQHISPFKLLQPYDKGDARVYFGRERESRQLAEALLRSKFILLCGASGTGKTSLIRCGLQGVFSPRDWLPIFVRRGNNFPDSLRTAVLEQYRLRYALRYPGQTPEISDDLPLREAIRQLFKIAYVPIYLILDQFEEIFTIGEETEQQAFFQSLNKLRLLEEDLFCKLLIVTREEYIAHFYEHEKSVPFLFDHRFRVEKMRRVQLNEVVTGTLTYPYPGYPPFQLEAGTADRIVENLTDERGEVDLTTLQVYLDRLYREDVERSPRRDHRLFDLALTGEHKLSNVLSDFLDQQVERVAKALKNDGRWTEDGGRETADGRREMVDGRQAGATDLPLQVLFKMVTSQGTKQHRSAAEIQAALDVGRISAPPEKVRACLELLASPEIRVLNRLRFAHDGAERYELAHDRLAQQLFGKFNAEEVRQREAQSTIENKQKRFAEAAGQPTAKQHAEYLTPGEIALVGQSLNLERLGPDSRAFFADSSRYHTRRRRRERLVTLFSVAAAVVFLGVAVFAFQQWQQSERARKVEELVSQSLLTAKVDATTAMQSLQKALDLAPDNSAALAALHEIYSNNEFYQQSFWHDAPVKGVFLAPDTSGRLYSWTENRVYRWHRDGRLSDTITIADLTAVTLSPDGRALILSAYGGALYFMDAADFKQRLGFLLSEDEETVEHLVFSPDGSTLFAATRQQVFRMNSRQWDKPARVFETESAISGFGINPCDKTLLIGFENGNTEIRTFIGKIKKAEKRHDDKVLSFSASLVEGSLSSVGRDGQLIFWKNNLHLKAHQPRANAVIWSPDSSRVFTCGNDYLIKSWSPQGDLIATYRGHSGFVNGLAVAADGQYFASAGEDHVVRLWKTESKVMQRYGPHQNGACGMVQSPDGRFMATISDQGRNDSGETLNEQGADFTEIRNAMFSLFPRTATIWDIASGKKINTLKGHKGGINAIAMTSDGQIMATASDDTSVILWNEKGDSLCTFSGGHTGKVFGVVFSPDQQRLVSVGEDKRCVIWNMEGQILDTIMHPDLIRRVSFFPDGQHFATGCYDGIVRIYDLRGVLILEIRPANTRRIEHLAISPDGRYLLTGEWGTHARLFTAAGDSVAVMQIFSENKTGASAVRSVAISPDGQYFALGAEGGLVQVYRGLNARRPLLVQTLQHYPKRAILALQFTPDGKGLFTGSNDHWVRRWNFSNLK